MFNSLQLCPINALQSKLCRSYFNFISLDAKKDVVRKFYVIRRHIDKDGAEVYDKIPADLSEDGTHLTFKTSKFSTYALAYSDSTVSNIVDNPQTYDGGLNSIIMAMISVMILVSASVYLVKSKA